MAAMCPLSHREEKPGLCIHEKLMLGMFAALAVLGGAAWALHLV